MSAQTKPTLTERLKSLWDSYGIEVLKFGTVGGAAFIVNSVTVWVLMITVMSEAHTKAKIIASIVATIFSWLMNRLWTFRDSRSENWKREAIEFGLVNLLGILVEAGCVAFSTYVLNLRTPEASFISGTIIGTILGTILRYRSEERRVGKECRARGSPYRSRQIHKLISWTKENKYRKRN